MTPEKNKTFQGNKLKFMRELNGYTLAYVSEKMSVSHQMVSKWENGKSIPNLAQQQELSKLLQINRLFFWNGKKIPVETATPFFRRTLSVPKKSRKAAQSIITLYSYTESQVSNELNLGYYIRNSYNGQLRMYDQYEIEELANSIRRKFKLGEGPISNIVLLVERLGIRVCYCDLSSEHIDAVTDELDGKPYIAINNSRSSVRMRFNLAHELGHIIMHGEKTTSNCAKDVYKRREEEANYFAGCLLMPEDGLNLDMSRTNLNYLVELKKHWKVSVQALITRGKQIGLIDEQQALYQRQEVSRRGWRKKEPFDDDIEIEKPSLIYSALKYNNKLNMQYIEKLGHSLSLDPFKVIEILGLDGFEEYHESTSYMKLV
ncbi:ImmA/IrrE family metallo-endopeptidase [Ligilactobacillus pobuzihii]|uniref:XRE family transcriptional regulator n=1 Tax=Ligilactobacillus pobuzihii TaxID=449659 RepID=UPI0019D25711|nr:XRE family transcriptional regulator [Ligilactobacillus pobuzihii]MBN7275556.1 ImmA/IrrE family metallo-endopeptidase [Ligilactobacillus pobuzihii]